jgi:glycosyltransferase involved in cell wall biosynthesis
MTDSDRPLVTFALFAYNQEKYIREAVEGAFSQTYQPLEIILSDDCSSDRTFAIMQEMAAEYKGPHDVRVRQSKVNRRLAGHISDVLEESRGEIISWAAGDDIAKVNRTEIFVNKLLECNDYVGVHSNVEEIDTNGNFIRYRNHSKEQVDICLDRVTALGSSVITQSHAFKRIVFETFGRFQDDLTQEGIAMGFREAALGRVAFLEDHLTLYRMGSGISTYSGMNIEKLKSSEPIKFTIWYLSAFKQMKVDSVFIGNNFTESHARNIKNNITFFSLLNNINQGREMIPSLFKNFVAAPSDLRSVRAFARRAMPNFLYRIIKR